MSFCTRRDLMDAFKIISTASMGLHVGGEAYIAYASHPGAMALDEDQINLYQRNVILRSMPLPATQVIGFLGAGAAYFLSVGTSQEDVGWMVAATGVFLILPYTVATLLPINGRFIKKQVPDAQVREVMSNWYRFHVPRVLFATSLFGYMVYKLAK